MKQQSDEAFVLATRELGDADLIVSLLARENGRLRCVAGSARRSRKRYGGMLQPLTQLKIAWTERPGRELHRLGDVELVRSFAELQGEPLALAVCATIAEIADCFASEGQADADGFRLLGAVLEALDDGADPVTMLRYHELWTLRLHGLFADLASCDECGGPLPERFRLGPNGEPRCDGCASGSRHRIERDALSFLAAARRSAPGEMPAGGPAVRPGAALEHLLRASLERFAERRFRGYRHVAAAARESAAAPRDGHERR